LETPFGTFFGPNITPDRETGIGAWSLADFQRAIRRGERPDGSHYFPAFPYPSFTGMADADVQDLWAFMRSMNPTRQANTPHDLRFPFGWRFLVVIWKWFFFTPGPGGAAPSVANLVERGAYLVRVLGHCGECHTPRNFLGGPKNDSPFSGSNIPEGKVPNITPTRLQKWSDDDLKEYFTYGSSPDGDIAVEPMSEVITNTTSKLTKDDLAAMVAYLRTLRPLPDTTE
jgi:mono/diheme cytochrome c family protein